MPDHQDPGRAHPDSSSTEPPATTGDAGAAGKRVSWAELFFDLVFVFAVTEVATLLHTEHSTLGLARAMVAFVPIYWVWVGTTVQANLHDLTAPRRRLGLFTIALAGLMMAIAVPDAYTDRGQVFALAYWIARIVIGSGLLTGARFVLNGFAVSMVLTGPLLVLGALLGGPVQLALWAVAAVIDLATPWMLRVRLAGQRFDAGHLTERFGAFVLIALGESVVTLGAPLTGTGPVTVAQLAGVVAGFALCAGLWWVYFHFAADAVRHAMATAAVQADITRQVLSYGHLLFIAAIVAMAVGLREVITDPLTTPTWGTVGLLFGGCALYLATFGYTRWRMFRQIATTRLPASAAALVLAPMAAVLPALAAPALLATGLAALNTLEYQRVRRRTER